MDKYRRIQIAFLLCGIAALAVPVSRLYAQEQGEAPKPGLTPPVSAPVTPQPTPPSALQGAETPATHSLGNAGTAEERIERATAGSSGALLKYPVSNLHPAGVKPGPAIKNPVADDPSAATRGMQYFTHFNCVGCHAPNGGGGMGPALSDRAFIYGSKPAQIYLSIVQGRPNGMPAWGHLLPDNVVWDLVAYIRQISQAPIDEWGVTISAKSPSIEQVPAEFKQTATPWQFTEPFSFGQKPQASSK